MAVEVEKKEVAAIPVEVLHEYLKLKEKVLKCEFETVDKLTVFMDYELEIEEFKYGLQGYIIRARVFYNDKEQYLETTIEKTNGWDSKILLTEKIQLKRSAAKKIFKRALRILLRELA